MQSVFESLFREIRNTEFQMKEKFLAWEAIVKNGGQTTSHSISPAILESWLRCRSLGIDPYSSIESKTAFYGGKKIRLPDNALDLMWDIFSDAMDYIDEKQCSISIYDDELFPYKRYNSLPDDEEFCFTASMKEEVAGTNAVDLAWRYKTPIILSGHEHYKVQFHGSGCVAVPVIMENEEIVGVISARSSPSYYAHFLLPTLLTIRRIFFNEIEKLPNNSQKTKIDCVEEILFEKTGYGFLVTDSSGRITRANDRIIDYIDLKPGDIIGKNCRNIFGKTNPIAEAIKAEKPTENEKLFLSIGKRNYIITGSIIPIYNDGKFAGILAMLKKKQSSIGSAARGSSLHAEYTFDSIAGKSLEMSKVVSFAKQAASVKSNVLIQGASGTGKELFAQAIHNASANKEGNFVAVNCSAIPQGLLESELFGYEGGSFTGAKKEGSKGKFELASGGSLFLDEINSMPIEMQAKILRAIQMHSITRVGGISEIPVDARIIAATNKDLWESVQSGEFREDLFFRINVISFTIPPLVDRREDIGVYINMQMEKLMRSTHWNMVISEKAKELLGEYNYPGNVRELENIIERSFVLAIAKNQNIITHEDIENYRGIKEYLAKDKGMQTNNKTNYEDSAVARHDELIQDGSMKGEYCIDDFEKSAIVKVLRETDGNISAAAEKLGMARNTMYRKIRIYNIERRGR